MSTDVDATSLGVVNSEVNLAFHIAEDAIALLTMNGATTASDLKESQMGAAKSEHHTTETVRVSDGYSAMHGRKEQWCVFMST
jgi:hypothetical protein